jgi:hypothetical protein
LVSVADPEGGRGDVRPPKNKGEKKRERERERERDRQTDRQTDRERERERGVVLLPSIIRLLNVKIIIYFYPLHCPLSLSNYF